MPDTVPHLREALRRSLPANDAIADCVLDKAVTAMILAIADLANTERAAAGMRELAEEFETEAGMSMGPDDDGPLNADVLDATLRPATPSKPTAWTMQDFDPS